jgi:TRAP-type C4-dicarboxylate transport system permease small subunit
MPMLGTAVEIVDKAVRALLAALLAVMVASVTWQIVSRYALSSPSSWTEELARFMLIWIGLVGGAYAYRRGMHLGLELLAERLEGRARALHAALVHTAVAIFAVFVLVGGGANLVALTFELSQYSPALGLPMAVVYCALPLSGVLLLLYAGAGLAACFRGNAGDVSGGAAFRANVPPVIDP